VTIPPPLPVLNEGRDFRVAAEPWTGFKQRGEEQGFVPAKRAAMALLAGAPALELEQGRMFLARAAKWLK
jgi:hypothetical protein